MTGVTQKRTFSTICRNLNTSLKLRAGLSSRPIPELLLLFLYNAQYNSAVQRKGFNLEIEAFVIRVLPYSTNLCPEPLTICGIPEVIGYMGVNLRAEPARELRVKTSHF